MALEAKRRVAAMQEHFRPVRTRLYADRRLDGRTRHQLLDIYAMSRLLYNAGVWGPLRQADGRKMRGAYMAVMRVVQGKVHNPTAPRFTDAQVLVDADKPSLEHKLMALRLKLLL